MTYSNTSMNKGEIWARRKNENTNLIYLFEYFNK